MRQFFLFCFMLGIFLIPYGSMKAYGTPKNEADIKNHCYPITSFDTAQEAVKKHKEIMDKKKLASLSSPVLMPTWLPFGATLASIRLLGCGSQLETEYVNGKHQI